jgi:hypothetical protein
MNKFIEFPSNRAVSVNMNLGEAFDIMVDHGNGRLLRGMERLNTQYINRHVFENVSKECWYDRYEIEINAYNMVLQEGSMTSEVIEACNKIVGVQLEGTYSA